MTLQLQKREDPALGSSAVTCIKAIRWVRRHAQCNVFEAFFGELISSFLRSKLPKDRCESVPLLLFALVQWERRILQRKHSGGGCNFAWRHPAHGLGNRFTFLTANVLSGRPSLLTSCLCGGSRTRLRSRTRASLSALSRQASCTTAATPGLRSGSGFLIRWLLLKFGILGLPLVSSSPPLGEHAQLLHPLAPMSYASCYSGSATICIFPWLGCPPEIPV